MPITANFTVNFLQCMEPLCCATDTAPVICCSSGRSLIIDFQLNGPIHH